MLPPQFGWTHVTLLIVVTQSHLIIHNLFEGMIWYVNAPLFPLILCRIVRKKCCHLNVTLLWLIRFIVPISCVICNDIMAYMFGFFFGRTPLIKVGHPAITLYKPLEPTSRT